MLQYFYQLTYDQGDIVKTYKSLIKLFLYSDLYFFYQ